MSYGDIEANKEIVRQLFRHLESGDISAVTEMFTDDGTFWSPSTRKTMTIGEFAGALQWVNTRLTAPMRYQVGTMTAEENRVCVLVESFANLINGKQYNNVYHFYFEIEGERIACAREYNDTAHIWATLRAED